MSESGSISVQNLDPTTMEHVLNMFPGYKDGIVRVSPGSCFLSSSFTGYLDDIHNLQLMSDDIFILSYPKNGTTWTQEMTWCIMNDLDFDKAKKTLLNVRVPFLESDAVDASFFKEQGKEPVNDNINLIRSMPSPRIIKSHLPIPLLPSTLMDTCKVISCIRNPKDTVVSYYHHHLLFHGAQGKFTGDFSDFVNYFMEDLVFFSPYWNLVHDVWQRRNHPNMCLISFEEMKADLPAVIRKVSKFLGKNLTDEQVSKLANHLSFKSMKSNSSVNKTEFLGNGYADKEREGFMRKGKTGDWKSYFTPEIDQQMDEWIAKNLEGSDLRFIYEIKE